MQTGIRSRTTAALALSVQLAVAILGTVGMCLDRPHTHGGRPAPECAMHHAASDEAADSTDHHGHHGGHQHPGAPTSSITCSCAGDGLLLLEAVAAVNAEPAALRTPDVLPAATPGITERLLDLRPAPLSPPPRPTLS